MKSLTKKECEFLTKLYFLLAEYNANISWVCGAGSDTHGIYEDAITVAMGNNEVLRTEPCCGYLDAHNMGGLLGLGEFINKE